MSCLRKWLIILFFYLQIGFVLGQVPIIDTLAAIDTSLMALLRNNGIVDDVKFTDFDYLLDFDDISDQLKHKIKDEMLPKVVTNIVMDTYYYKGDSSYLYPTDVVYSMLRFGTKLSSFGVPIELRGNITAKNGQLNKDFSTFSIAFDSNSALRTLGKDFLPSFESGSSIIARLRKSVELDDLEEHLLTEELKTLFFQKMIAHPKYRQIKDSILLEKKVMVKKIDTLKEKQDTIFQQKEDSLQLLLDSFEKLEAKYSDLWERRDRRMEQLSGLRERLIMYKQEVNTFINPNRLKTYLIESGKTKHLTVKEKLGVFLKGASVGLVSFDDREFTFQNLTVLGGLVEYEGKKFFSSVGYGRHNLSQNLSFFSDRIFAKGYEGNRFLCAKVGIGSLSSDFVQVSYLKSTQNESNFNIGFITPNNNTVVAVAMRQEISQKSAIVTDIAVSKQDVLPIDIQSTTTNPSQDNLAFSLKTELMLIKEQVKMDFGYFLVGPAFFSAGNPFLLTNRKGIHSAVSSSFFKNRVFVKGHVNYAISKVSSSANSVPLQRFDFSVESKIRVFRKHSILLRYAPTTNYRSLAQSQYNSRNYMYMIQGHSQFDLLQGTKLSSTLSFSNMQSSFDNVDTSFVLDNSYLMVQEALVIGRKIITGTGMMTSQDFFRNTISDYRAQLEYKQMYKDFSYHLGGLVEKRKWDNGLRKFGVVSGVTYHFLKNYSISLQSTIRRVISAPSDGNGDLDLVGQLSLLGKF